MVDAPQPSLGPPLGHALPDRCGVVAAFLCHAFLDESLHLSDNEYPLLINLLCASGELRPSPSHKSNTCIGNCTMIPPSESGRSLVGLLVAMTPSLAEAMKLSLDFGDLLVT